MTILLSANCDSHASSLRKDFFVRKLRAADDDDGHAGCHDSTPSRHLPVGTRQTLCCHYVHVFSSSAAEPL